MHVSEKICIDLYQGEINSTIPERAEIHRAIDLVFCEDGTHTRGFGFLVCAIQLTR